MRGFILPAPASPVHVPSKHAGSDPEAFWLRPVMAITASMQPLPGRIVYAGSDFSHAILSRSSKEGLDHIVSHQVSAKRIWSGSKPVCKNHRAQFWQNTNGPLPLSHFQTRLHSFTDGLDHTVQNQTGSDWVLADCAGLIRKQASLQNHRARFWPTLPSRSGCFLGLSSIDH